MANPVVTGMDGYTIGASLHGSSINGLWFFGLAGINGKQQSIQVGVGATIQNCVFINMPEAVDGLTEAIVRNCIFINCGWGTLQHSIYYSDSQAASNLLEDCIFIGGQGHHIHLFHSPSNTIVRRNFSARAQSNIAIQGDGNDVYNNFIWSGGGFAFYDSNYTFHDNHIGQNVGITSSTPPADHNYFYLYPTPFGTNQVSKTWDDFAAKTGYTFTQIENIAYYLDNVKTFTREQLLADTSIVSNSALIRDMMTKLLA